MKINVLWIDDQWEEQNGFIDLAANFSGPTCDEGIIINPFDNVSDGIKELISPQIDYHAIILDANCVYGDGNSSVPELPEMSALQFALRKITENHIDIPWFVYSAGGLDRDVMIDNMVKGYKKTYHIDKLWYKKSVEEDIDGLFDKIVEVAQNSDLYKLGCRYPEIYEFWPHHKELAEILIKALDAPLHTDASVFNKIRKQLEEVFKYCYECGVLLNYDEKKISDHSYALGHPNLSKAWIVPLYVQCSFKSLTKICNVGSHSDELEKNVKANETPYLIRSTIYEFLNVLDWLRSLPKDEAGRDALRKEVKKMTLYEGEEWVVAKHGKYFHCGECKLPFAEWVVGKKVQLEGVIDNNDPDTMEKYPFFARFKEIKDYNKKDQNKDKPV